MCLGHSAVTEYCRLYGLHTAGGWESKVEALGISQNLVW